MRNTNNMIHKIVATNSKGQQLNGGQWWSITKPIPEPTDAAQNVVYHVGKEKYIRRLWNKNFAD
jgi:hypothetical protein